MKPIGKKAIQKGFTLIELMIVIAIIAILAAIAIPQYEHYIARSQFSEALTITNGLKTSVISYWDQNGAMPTTADPGFENVDDSHGKYVASVGLTGNTILVTFKGTGVSAALSGKTVTLTPGTTDAGTFTVLSNTSKGAIVWQCSTSVTDFSDVPSACRTASPAAP